MPVSRGGVRGEGRGGGANCSNKFFTVSLYSSYLQVGIQVVLSTSRCSFDRCF